MDRLHTRLQVLTSVMLAIACADKTAQDGDQDSDGQTSSEGADEVVCTSLSPVHDSTVFSLPDSRATPLGHTEHLCVMAWTFGGENGTYRSYFDFGIKQAIPIGATIESADLRLFHSSSSPDETQSGANFSSIYAIEDAWTEDDLTWDTQVNFQLGPKIGELASSVAPDEDYVIDLTAGVQQLLDGPWTSFVIRLDAEVSYRRLYFGSRERSVVDERPVLDVCYTAG